MPEDLPHRHLYTRLGVTPDKGIGVFALHAIPAGTNPFYGDDGDVVRIPAAEVEGITDPEIRAMYVDFCPLQDGSYVAPLSFNLLTTGWYMNHSDEPNIEAGKGLAFVAARPIAKGEELTIDYRQFSENAERVRAKQNDVA